MIKIQKPHHYWILFFFWPFFTLISALTDFKNKNAQFIVIAFIIYYSLTYIIGNIGFDSYNYSVDLINMENVNFQTFTDAYLNFFKAEESIDFFVPIVMYIVSRITVNFNVLLGLIAIIYGSLYIKSIDFVYKEIKYELDKNTLFLIIYFASIITIFSLTSFRFWTAAWLYFYCSIQFIKNKKQFGYFLITILSPLIHFSFIPAVLVFIIYIFVGNRERIFLIILIVSFVAPTILSNYFNISIFSETPGLEKRYNMYASESYIEKILLKRSNLNWYVRINFNHFFVIFGLFYARLKAKKYNIKDGLNIYAFSILFLALCNFGADIGSFDRFYSIFYLFAIVYIIKIFFNLKYSDIHFYTLFGIFIFLIETAVNFRLGIETINLWLFAPSLLGIFLTPVSLYLVIYSLIN